jgi:phosphomannomutase
MALFGTAGIRGSVTEVTPSLALRVGRAMAGVITCVEPEATVVIGRDGRTTGQALSAAFTGGLLSGGVAVRHVGQVPTPAVAFASQGRFGVMLTASHNPPTDNGIKLFIDGVEFDADREGAIERAVERNEPPVAWHRWRAVEQESVLARYRHRVVSYARSHGDDLGSIAIAVDCGNGMASVATPRVLRGLGATVEAINSHVDGRFPGRASKPTPETIGNLCRFVANGPARVGYAHDGDADRIVVVDETGAVVHEDTIVAILAEHYVRRSDVDDPVVITTPNASARIDERVRAAGGHVDRVNLGALHEGIAEARDRGDHVVFAGEPWKHLHPELGGWIDGVASAAVLTRLIAEADGLDRLRAPVTEAPYRKLSVECPEPNKDRAMAQLTSSLPDEFPDATVSDEFGIRLDLDTGSWILVRPSGTEPYLRIYAEGDDVDALIETARSAVLTVVESA